MALDDHADLSRLMDAMKSCAKSWRFIGEVAKSRKLAKVLRSSAFGVAVPNSKRSELAGIGLFVCSTPTTGTKYLTFFFQARTFNMLHN